MKVVFEVKGEFDISDISEGLDELEGVMETLRGFGSAEGKYKIVVEKDEWKKL